MLSKNNENFNSAHTFDENVIYFLNSKLYFDKNRKHRKLFVNVNVRSTMFILTIFSISI